MASLLEMYRRVMQPVPVTALFVAPLNDEELAVLERALAKVTVDCTFG